MKKFSSLLVVSLLMLASFTAGVEYQRGDVSQDGHVDIADVTCLINYLLHGTWDDEPVTPPDEHEWVDLGLPSSTLWATCNVGASSSEEYGDYFAWGETTPKVYYGWSTYKWFATGASQTGFTKYCCDSSAGYFDFDDITTELNPADDAATMNWGPNWQMPSDDQLEELVQSCSWQWTQRNGVNGYLVTGPNGNSMFLPVTGLYVGSSRVYAGSNGEYWSRTLFTEYYPSSHACYLAFHQANWYWFGSARFYGHPVRPVRVNNWLPGPWMRDSTSSPADSN